MPWFHCNSRNVEVVSSKIESDDVKDIFADITVLGSLDYMLNQEDQVLVHRRHMSKEGLKAKMLNKARRTATSKIL